MGVKSLEMTILKDEEDARIELAELEGKASMRGNTLTCKIGHGYPVWLNLVCYSEGLRPFARNNCKLCPFFLTFTAGRNPTCCNPLFSKACTIVVSLNPPL